MKVKFILKVVMITLVFSLLCGCATTMSAANKQSIHTIAIDPHVVMPDQMIFVGDGSQFGAPFGLLGQAIGQTIVTRDTKSISQIETTNKIDFPMIVSDAIATQIKTQNVFMLNDKNPDALLKITIGEYGLMARDLGFSSKLAPMIGVQAKLLRNNQVVWSNHALVTDFNSNTLNYSLSEIRNNPELLKDMWNSAAKIVAKELIETMNA